MDLWARLRLIKWRMLEMGRLGQVCPVCQKGKLYAEYKEIPLSAFPIPVFFCTEEGCEFNG